MTRFNLATPGKEFALRTQPGWLEGRFELFERYCLPSVAAQTNRDFDWIIYFDIDTPSEFKARIERLREVFPFTPYYTGLFRGEGWARSVRETYELNTPLLLSTRLDNDDALASDFMERLHANVAAHDHALGSYNFSNGLIRSGTSLYAHRHESNAFSSLLEPVSPDLRTAPATQHMHIAKSGPVYQIEGPAMWLQIVHETNVSNKIRGARVPPHEVAVSERFLGAGGEGFREVSHLRCALENMTSGAVRGLRDTAVRIVRRS